MDIKALSEEERRERESLRNLILHHTNTLEEVREARRRLRDWLSRHPDDYPLLGEGEMLYMLESALKGTNQ
ncbi:MAG: hypothetical protein AB1457_14510 [Chloroflexota bacterium]